MIDTIYDCSSDVLLRWELLLGTVPHLPISPRAIVSCEVMCGGLHGRGWADVKLNNLIITYLSLPKKYDTENIIRQDQSCELIVKDFFGH